jgi:hypothetical protein
LVDFSAIFVVSLILAILVNFSQNAYDIAFSSTTGAGSTLFGSMPAGYLTVFGTFMIPVIGLLVGSLWVSRRVGRVKVGGWKEVLAEGTPGAVKLLSGTDWDSVLSSVRISRIAFLLYALVKVAGYTIVTMVLLFFVSLVFPVFFFLLPSGYWIFLSLAIVLLLTRKSLSEGLRRLQLLDQLFWDLRVFSTEFNRAEFIKA